MTETTLVSRRGFLAGGISLLGLTAAGCTPTARPQTATPPPPPAIPERVQMMYAAMPGEPYRVPAVDLSQLDPKYWRQRVPYPTDQPVGTIVVDTPNRFLYLVESAGQAMRYGVGIGRAGFAWSGDARIAWKREWPTWTPPREMVERQPELEKYWPDGQPPGPQNPLGARALYIFEGGRDTLYRVHGTPEVWSIGRAVSSGCVRLLQQDIIDLYGRVGTGGKIVVLQAPSLENPTGFVPQTVQEAVDAGLA